MSPEADDHRPIVAKFKADYPESEWVPYLEQVLAEKERAANYAPQMPITYLDNAAGISTLPELLAQFAGRRVYVDLWATWCAPCKAEFSAFYKLMEFFDRHQVTPLFISIDDARDEAKWRAVVKGANLLGYHARASDALQEDIQQRIYGHAPLSVPRYLLVDERGNILNPDAARPSSTDFLKQQMIKAFKLKE
jgi:thiol-disulfide isomerase/thioredoxin